jgi:hypothetical protein
MNQLSIQYEPIITACTRKAETVTPDFAEKAKKIILDHLAIVKQCKGEELVDIARAKGAVPHDDRAFGGIFQSLSQKNLIRHVAYCERRKGHGTGGGRIWGIVL